MGLSVGMAVSILIFYFVSFETSYDDFHRDSNLIYRIISVNRGTGGTDYRATTPLPLPEVIRTEIEDAEITTALTPFLYDDEPVQIADQSFFNLTGYTADSCFLKVFNFQLIIGDPNTVFNNPGSVVLTRKTAKILFGNLSPLGKELIIADNNFTITGVLKDLPENSVFKFDLLVSGYILKKLHPNLSEMWWGGGALTYIKVYHNPDMTSVKSGLASIPVKYFPDYLKGRESYDLQPLEKIHLDNRVSGDSKPPVSAGYLFILIVIAIGILFIACANFVNLSTSQSEKRARETGLRKLAGAGRFQVSCMFIGEAVSMTMVALVLAVFMAKLSLPWFNELTQRNISLDLSEVKLLLSFLLFGLFTGVLSGIYPAILFSGFQPVQLLSKKINPAGTRNLTRKAFIILQFVITIVLIISQMFITRQISYLKNHELGFNEEGLISMPLNIKDENKRLSFANLFEANIEREGAAYNIEGVAVTENVPGRIFPNRFAVIPGGSTPEDSKEMIVTSVDGHYTDVFQINELSGRILSDTIESDRFGNVMINETAAKILGWDNPVGKKLRFKHEEESLTIIGVIKDINFRSLQSPVEPVVYRYTGANWLAGFITLRADQRYYPETISLMKKTWEELAPGAPFQYFFIKDKYIEKYRDEERLANVVGTFTVIAVFLSCLGLFALISWLSLQRTKEIGIRKINGARISEIMYMLSSEFIKLVTIAYIIACPVSWEIMHKWLHNFAYKTELNWMIFLLSGFITLGLTILTVSFHTWRAATKNPVEALRYE